MRIDGPGKSQNVDKSKSTKKAASGDSSFKTLLDAGSDGAEETSSVGVSAGISTIDGLLAVQAAEDPAERQSRQRMKQRADKLLTMLDDMRMGLLNGTVNIGQMVDLANVVSTHREKIADPELTAILDEIDLRAQIELARLEVAREKLS